MNVCMPKIYKLVKKSESRHKINEMDQKNRQVGRTAVFTVRSSFQIKGFSKQSFCLLPEWVIFDSGFLLRHRNMTPYCLEIWVWRVVCVCVSHVTWQANGAEYEIGSWPQDTKKNKNKWMNWGLKEGAGQVKNLVRGKKYIFLSLQRWPDFWYASVAKPLL